LYRQCGFKSLDVDSKSGDEWPAIAAAHQCLLRKSLRQSSRPPTPKNKRKRSSFTPSLERRVSSCERIFANLSSKILLGNDRENNHRKVRNFFFFFKMRLCVFFCAGVSDVNPVCVCVFSVDILGFFCLALPPEGELSLEELHLIVGDIWLTRHDGDLEQERARRRKGRPKSAKEIQIEELKIREAEEYRTGFGSSLSHSLSHF
jgi:hypothetical protein